MTYRSDQATHGPSTTRAAGPRERRLALTVVLASLVIFLAVAPFAKVRLPPVWAFIPIYESALVINDLITAALLLGQFGFFRSRALLVAGGGYLFTASMAAVHALTFPGLFAADGLLGATPQTTAWLYMFWHGAFPLAVIAYALLKDGDARRGTVRHPGPAIAVSAGAIVVIVAALTFLVTARHDALPAIMDGDHYTPMMRVVVGTTWALSLVALLVLWWRRSGAVLDLWLTVVMCAWLCDIGLSAVLNAGRFDLGFYAGRLYGLLAASFVLVVLLFENAWLYARLGAAHEALEAQNRSLDQTVRERTERLVQSEKVATMGSLLAGVAHELNNPLSALLGHTQLLANGRHGPEIAGRTAKIAEAAQRCVRIVRNFLALARQRPPEWAPVQLAAVIDGAVELLAYELRSDGVRVERQVAPELPLFHADPHQLHQVFVNLIANAHQAMRRQQGPRSVLLTATHDAARNVVRVQVADTGPGMPPEVRARVFEPFFTTKPLGEGTGLGLSLCRGMIDEHGGTIEVDSQPGRGTCFTIELPVTSRRPGAAPAPAAVEPLAPVPPQTILVVDDEPEVAAVIAEALQRDGHTTEVAANGAAALDLLRHRTYDLIISDTRMPVMDGETFFAELERRDPAVRRRLIFLTGDVLSREKREFLEKSGAPFLTKPCDLDDLRRLVHRVVAHNAR